MLSFPLWYLLVPFGLVLLAAVVFFFFNVFHIRRYGIRSGATSLLLLAYLASFSVLIGGIALIVSSYEWQEEVATEDLLPDFEAPHDFGL